jgi:transposase
MGRLTATQKEQKMREAKNLYMRGYNITEVSGAIQVGPKAIRSWITENKWAEEREYAKMTVKDLINKIKRTLHEIAEGKKAKISPDDLSKLAKAIERLEDPEKSLRFAIPAFEALSASLYQDMREEPSAQGKELAMIVYQRTRAACDKIIIEMEHGII